MATKGGPTTLNLRDSMLTFGGHTNRQPASFFYPYKARAEKYEKNNVPDLDGGVRQPMIIKWPGVTTTAGDVCEEPVISTDFSPTILERQGFR